MTSCDDERPRISIIVPFYGQFPTERLQLAIESLGEQRDISLEVIVATGTKVFRMNPASYTHKLDCALVSSIQTCPPFRPGAIRNQGVLAARARYVYLSDADVVFLDPYYLARLLSLLLTRRTRALCRPPMRRLPQTCFYKFQDLASRFGIQQAIGMLDFSQPYLGRIPGFDLSLRVFKKYEHGRFKTFIATEEDYQFYSMHPNAKGDEPLYWTQDIHCGGVFGRKEQFCAVGGYSNEFIGWGCVDADLQWKLSACYDLQRISKEKHFEVLHLDHSRDHYSREDWLFNRSLQESRRSLGIEAAIVKDVRHFKAVELFSVEVLA